MKENHIPAKLLVRSTLAPAMLGLAVFPPPALAQPKGAEKLMQLRPPRSTAGPAVAPTGSAAPACPKCKTTSATVVEWSPKGAQAQLVKHVLRHDCPDCNTTFVTTGHGKMKTQKTVHVCEAGGGALAACGATHTGAETK